MNRAVRASSRSAPSLEQLGRYAIARNLFRPTTLSRAIARLGFVQADPIRAPARAQDLILLHRVRDYRTGDLERRYPRLPIEEAFFVNYGFLPRETAALLHPRRTPRSWDATLQAHAKGVLDFVRQHGPTQSKDVQARFDHGSIERWGASLNASTHLLEGLHYSGQLRVAARATGARIYQAVTDLARAGNRNERLARAGQLLDVAVKLYAPLTATSLGYLGNLLRHGVPHLAAEVRQIQALAKSRYHHAEVDGLVWFWPSDENPWAARQLDADTLWLLSPFDPLVWDRRRFRSFWGWEYKFEAYVPVQQRRMGHYAMPVLWREAMLGWANLKLINGRLQHELGFSGPRPRDKAFQRALNEALQRMEQFLVRR